MLGAGSPRLPDNAIGFLKGVGMPLKGNGFTLLRFRPKDSFELSNLLLTIRALMCALQSSSQLVSE